MCWLYDRGIIKIYGTLKRRRIKEKQIAGRRWKKKKVDSCWEETTRKIEVKGRGGVRMEENIYYRRAYLFSRIKIETRFIRRNDFGKKNKDKFFFFFFRKI